MTNFEEDQYIDLKRRVVAAARTLREVQYESHKLIHYWQMRLNQLTDQMIAFEKEHSVK